MVAIQGHFYFSENCDSIMFTRWFKKKIFIYILVRSTEHFFLNWVLNLRYVIISYVSLQYYIPFCSIIFFRKLWALALKILLICLVKLIIIDIPNVDLFYPGIPHMWHPFIFSSETQTFTPIHHHNSRCTEYSKLFISVNLLCLNGQCLCDL